MTVWNAFPSLPVCMYLPVAWASELEPTALGARLHSPFLLQGRCDVKSSGQRIDTSATSGSYDSVRGMPLWGLRPLRGQCRDHWGSIRG